MNKTHRIQTTCLALLLAAATALAGFSKVGTTGANFLKISIGRASGMGDAFTAVADDASAAFYNPAGLFQARRSVHFNHADWFADINHDYLAAVLPVASFGTIGLSVTALTMGDIEQTTIDNPNTRAREDEGTGLLVSASDLAFGVTYSRSITDKLSFGLTAKGVQQSIWDMSATAAGLDVGLFYNTGFKSLRIGAAVTNFGTQLAFTGRQLDYTFFWDDSGPTVLPGSYKTTPAPLPTTFRFGIAMDVLDAGTNRLTAAIDLTHPSDINETVNFGLEYGLAKLLFLRAGYVLNTDPEYQEHVGALTGLSAGMGLHGTPVAGLDLGLDYAFRYYRYVKPTHRVMLTVGF